MLRCWPPRYSGAVPGARCPMPDARPEASLVERSATWHSTPEGAPSADEEILIDDLQVPNPLVLDNGDPVDDVATWEKQDGTNMGTPTR